MSLPFPVGHLTFNINRERITSWVIKSDKIFSKFGSFAKSAENFYQFRNNGSYFFSLSWEGIFGNITNYVTFGTDPPTVFSIETLKLILFNVYLKDWSSTKYPEKEHSRILTIF